MATLIYNEQIECMSRDEMQALQLSRLKDAVSRVRAHVPFYRDRIDCEITCLEDIAKVPFTVKEDLRQHYPYGMFAVPMEEVVRVHASSGTTGKSTVVGYTKGDIEIWSECVARLVCAAGVTRGDIAQVAFGYGLFTGAFGLHYGLEKVGATVVPVSSGNTERQISIMADFGATALIATPSYAMYMSEVAESMGMLDKIKLKYGLFGAEGSTEEMRAQLEKRWGIIATENYGLSEIIGPGVSGECVHKCGMHINEDHFLCEIIDPNTGEVLPDGQQGEMVITTLTKQAFPLIRYRTRDITRILPTQCACGRTTYRMEKCQGRSDDMLIIRGVNVFPSQIEGVLLKVEGIGPHYEIIVTRENFVDQIEVMVELVDESKLTDYRALDELRKYIATRMRVVCQIDMKVRLVSPNTLKRFEGKAKRVIDKRAEGT